MKDLSNISVVLPSLDPDEKLHAVIDGLLEYGFTDIILVNDGSKQENLHYFEEEAAAHPDIIHLLHHEVNKGKGAALKNAFNWFLKNRGTALGLASMGSGIGAMVMSSAINWFIESWGWRSAYRISAVLMFVVVVPLVFFVLRVRPSDKGLQPYGAGEQTETGKPVTRFEGFAYREVIRMPLFYVVGAVSVTQVMSICIFYQTVSPHLSDMGYTTTFAAAMASITMGALAVGKIILGKLFDKFGTRRAAVTACSCTLLGLVGMIFCTFRPALVLIVLGVGLGCSFGAVCMPIIVQNIFGMKDYNAVYGKLTACTGVGAAVAPMLSGWVFDISGSYVPIYIAAVCTVACAIVVLWKNLPDKDNVRG